MTVGARLRGSTAASFSVYGLPCRVSVLRSRGGIECVRLFEAGRAIQLHCRGASVLDGPVSLNFSDADLRQSRQRLLTLERLITLLETGEFPPELFKPHPRASRLRIVLQAFDGKEAGADYRQIAEAILGTETVARGWPGKNRSMKERVRNYVREARAIVSSEYRRFLR